MKALKFGLVILSVALIVLSASGCSKKESKTWTYDAIMQEAGGIIEMTYSELYECMGILRNHKDYVCGYVVDKKQDSFAGHEMYLLYIADKEDETDYKNKMNVYVSKEQYGNIKLGDFVYVYGRSCCNLSTVRDSVSLSTTNDDEKISTEKILEETPSSVYWHEKNLIKFYKDTSVRVAGVIVRDYNEYSKDYVYKLYESEEAYKNNKYDYISVEFYDQHSDFDLKTVTIVGLIDVSMVYEITDASICD